MRDDYPPPAHAGMIWFAQGRLWLSAGGRVQSFDSSSAGLASLHVALLALSERGAVLGCAGAAGEVAATPVAATPARRFTPRGKEIVVAKDIW